MAFVGNRTIRGLNARFRDRDCPTDVLSFSYGGDGDEETPYLGDIVIAVDVACSNAVSRKIPPDIEVRRLLVHGLLHLLGYDHETDSGEMNLLQARLLRRKSITDVRTVMAAPGPAVARRRAS